MAASKEKLQTILDNLPATPGVYLMKNNKGEIIYIGKARSLRSRVRSYFVGKHTDSPKTRVLVRRIADLDYILTDSEMEALILEANLIKEHKPRYNINLKDDKSYPYIRITAEEFPRVFVTRRLIKDGSRYFGPYTSVGTLRETMELLKRLFPYRSCNQVRFTNKRPCLNAHIGRCLAPCVGNIGSSEYAEIIRQVELFLAGKEEQLVDKLQLEMERAATKLEFEKAAALRDKITAIEKLIAKQKVSTESLEDRDVIALAEGFDEVLVQILFVRGGKLLGKEERLLGGTDGVIKTEIIASFLQQYYPDKTFIPHEILVEESSAEIELIGEWLGEKQGRKIEIRAPQRGEKREILELAKRNADESLALRLLEKENKRELVEDALVDLQTVLNLSSVPERIECFDISNTQGSLSVASMVVFKGGVPAKKEYRRFRIKSVEGADDYASMSEVLDRRLARLPKTDEEEAANGFAARPDLILVDGGKGQVTAAFAALQRAGCEDIPLYGLAEREEELFRPGEKQPLGLPRDSKSLYLLQRIRDEAHRFALTYHRSLRGKESLGSILEDIPGIGPARRKSLLERFGSLRKINEATVTELAEVPGISAVLAEEVHVYLATHADLALRLRERRGEKNRNKEKI